MQSDSIILLRSSSNIVTNYLYNIIYVCSPCYFPKADLEHSKLCVFKTEDENTDLCIATLFMRDK